MKINKLFIYVIFLCFTCSNLFPDEIKFEASNMDVKDNGNIILGYNSKTFIPLENKTVREQALKQVMYASFTDRENKWFLEKDGKYFKYFGDQTNFSSHSYFMKNPSLSGQGSLSDVYKKSNNTLLKNQKK